MSKDGVAQIDAEKCVACGTCVYQCPFGATLDVSSIVDIIKTIMASENNRKYRAYAIVAPAIAGQFSYAKPGQVVSAIRELGFYDVEEVALGADIVAYNEAGELSEKDFLTSSCCPAFVRYIETKFPEMKEHISSSLSPMAETGRFIKEHDPDSKVVFIGPCTSKKAEVKKPEVNRYVDYVMTFEELQALIDSKDIDVNSLPDAPLNHASYFGRIFARSGGVSEAVKEAVRERELKDFNFDPAVFDVVDKCRVALLKASKGLLPNNFIEGMICENGCINGAACLSHGNADKKLVDEYSESAGIKSISGAIEKLRETHARG